MPICCLPQGASLWQLHGGARLPQPQASVSPAKVVPVLVWRPLGAGPGGSGLAAFHSAEETLLTWVGWLSLLGVLSSCPASDIGCSIQVKITRHLVSTTMWTHKAAVSLSVVLGSHTPGPLRLKIRWGGVGGLQGVPGWSSRWQQASERTGRVGAEEAVHPRPRGGFAVPG